MPAPAVLLIDAAGTILLANAAADELLHPQGSQLRGRAFASLFEFEVVSDEPEALAAQWEALVGAAEATGEQALDLKDPTGTHRVFLGISASDDGTGNRFATLRPATEPASAAQTGALDEAARIVVESGEAGFFDLDFRAGRFVFTATWKRILGYAPAELADDYATWTDLLHPEDSGAAPDRMARRTAGAGRRPFSVEFRMKHRLGHWVWVSASGAQVTSEDGSLGRACGFMMDISDRKELEEATQAADDRMRELGGESLLGLFDVNFETGEVWLSDSFKRLVGYDADELPSDEATLVGLLPPEDAEGGLAYWLGALGGSAAGAAAGTGRLRHREGRWVPVTLGGRRSYSRTRDLTRFVGYAFAGAEAGAPGAAGAGTPESILKAALDSLAEGVLATDARGRIVISNEAARRLLGRPQEAIEGRPVPEVFRLVHAATGKLLPDDPCEMALASEGPLPLSVQHALAPAKAGEPPIPLAWTARAAYGEGPVAEGVVIVFRNPDEMTLTPEELVKANRFEALALLAGGITHDFNNLLTTILGGISLAKTARDTGGLDDSEQACMTAKALAKQLLSFAKGGSGARSVVAPREILTDSLRIAAAGATVQTSLEIPDTVPPVQVDRSQILQVFQNLIVNSIQAMPPAPHRGTVALSAEPVTLAEGEIEGLTAGDYVRFEVRDNGSGIRPEILERIWDPFFTTKKHGTGLGLATVLSIVRKHGGQIGVSSETGVGTVFTIYLPVADAPIEAQARRAPTLRYGTGRILFMDDDPKICAITDSMLQSLEYAHDIARNGEEVIKLYRSYFNIGRPYDVVIMDLTVIGGMGGEEAFRALREIDPDVRAIAASGYDNEDMARRFLDLGFCAYLTKPYRVGDLARVLKAVLG
ncbi:blue-light-activated protein [mine drainage metagenome]|uniref:Blue-light-activated protein n=1 Tax=mine drainage metagenome TaxID=410659 RepID=A0A1J5S7F9_9ZZZZ